MKMCQPHWDRLKQAVINLGAGDLIAPTGEAAIAQLADELADKPKTLENFDPLMNAHNLILANAMDTLASVGVNPLSLLCADPEHPERECPICYLNWLSLEHDRTCTVPDCKKVKGQTFDDWIDKAAEGSAQHAAELKAAPESDSAPESGST